MALIPWFPAQSRFLGESEPLKLTNWVSPSEWIWNAKFCSGRKSRWKVATIMGGGAIIIIHFLWCTSLCNLTLLGLPSRGRANWPTPWIWLGWWFALSSGTQRSHVVLLLSPGLKRYCLLCSLGTLPSLYENKPGLDCWMRDGLKLQWVISVEEILDTGVSLAKTRRTTQLSSAHLAILENQELSTQWLVLSHWF